VITVKAAAVGTTFIGGLWAVLALLYSPGPTEQDHGFATGLAVAITGAAITAAATWWENHR
jgi:hypothetical protein